MAGQRTLPGLGLSAYWTKGTGNWDVQHDPDTRKLSALCQCHVKSRVALPGSPVDGDMYLSPANAGTNPNQIMARDNGAWVYFAPQKGWWVFVEDENSFVYWTGVLWQLFQPGTVLPDITGRQDKVLKVNAGGTGLVWADDLQGSGGGGDPTDPVSNPLFQPHMYWRLFITAGSTGSPFIRIGDLEFLDNNGVEISGTDGAAFADVSAAGAAFDGSLSSYWDSAGLNHYVGWQFNDATRVFGVRIRPVSSEGNVLRGFRIDYSDDGNEWAKGLVHVPGDGDLPNETYTTFWLPRENKLLKARIVTTTADDALGSDVDKLIIVNSAVPSACTLPPTLGQLGDVLTWLVKGAGQLTIVGGAGVTVQVPEGFSAASKSRYVTVSAIKSDANEWVLTGALAEA